MKARRQKLLTELLAMGKDIENYSQAELARLLGVTRDDIHSVVRQVPRYQPRPRWTKDTRNLTEKLLAMGKAVEDYSQTELARKFHVPRKTVANRVPGLIYKPKGRPPEYGNAWKRIFALGKAVCSLNEAELPGRLESPARESASCGPLLSTNRSTAERTTPTATPPATSGPSSPLCAGRLTM